MIDATFTNEQDKRKYDLGKQIELELGDFLALDEELRKTRYRADLELRSRIKDFQKRVCEELGLKSFSVEKLASLSRFYHYHQKDAFQQYCEARRSFMEAMTPLLDNFGGGPGV